MRQILVCTCSSNNQINLVCKQLSFVSTGSNPKQLGLDNSLASIFSSEQPKECIKDVLKSLSHLLIILQFAL